MKKRVFRMIAIILVAIIALSSCKTASVAKLTDKALAAEKLIDFANGANADVLFESDGWSNGDVFNVVWKKSNVHYENGIMRLGITEEKATAWLDDAEVEFDYTAGEARTQNYYHYGDFEVCMKPSANPGTASTFFTCTGPYDTKFVLDDNGDYKLDENGQRITVNNPHDEIDIEFLGKDTTKVQFNYFVNGVGGHEYMYDLGFDASKEFHTYGYRWEPTAITWFVDGVPVYKVTTDKNVTPAKNVVIVDVLPSTPGRILTNYWCGNSKATGWMGSYKGDTKDNGTEYKWIATSAAGAPLNPEEKPNEEITGIDWASIAAINPTFESTEVYTVNNNGTQSNVTYSNVGGSSYINVEMDITAASADKNYLHLTVTNNGQNTASVRVNVVDAELVSAGAQNMSTNQSATMDGVAVFTDAVWGGSFFEIAAGQTAELVIAFNGQVEKLQLMLDSSRNDALTYAGDITVDNIKFAKVGEIVNPDPGTDPDPNPNPEDPAAGAELNFSAEPDTGYEIANGENGSVNVKYNGPGNTWKPITADIAALAAGKNTLTIHVTNNGTADARVRFDVQGTNWVATGDGSGTDATNVSATGGDIWTDLTWGGSTLTVPAGTTVTVTITYDGNSAQGAVRNLLVFVDSARGDGNTYNADITLSGIAFDGNTSGETEGTELTFVTGSYNITPNNVATDSLEVAYENITGGTYQNVCANIADIANGNNTFTLTMKNTGTTTVRVRIDIKATNTVGNTNVCNQSATGGSAWTDLEWGGSFVDIAPGAEVTVTVRYDANEAFGPATELLLYFDTSTYGDTNTYSGKLTLSNFSFSKAD